MNLLFVDQFAHFGGAQKVLWQTLKSLDSPDVTVRVALNGAGKFKDALVAEGIPVLDLPLGNYSSRRKTIADILRFCIRTAICAWKLVGYGHENTVDLLYANGPRTFIATAMAGRWLRKPVIWHLQNVLTSKSEIWTLQIFSRWVSRILVCSKAVAAPLLAQRANLEARIRLVYNPLPDWDAVPSGDGLRSQPARPLFRNFGRITPFKGQKCFLMAARTVLVQCPQHLLLGHRQPCAR